MSLLVSCDGKLLTSCDGKLLVSCPPQVVCDLTDLLATLTVTGSPINENCKCTGGGLYPEPLALFLKNFSLDTMPVSLPKITPDQYGKVPCWDGYNLGMAPYPCAFDGKVGTVEIWQVPDGDPWGEPPLTCADAVLLQTVDVRLAVHGEIIVPPGSSYFQRCYWTIYLDWDGGTPLWQVDQSALNSWIFTYPPPANIAVFNRIEAGTEYYRIVLPFTLPNLWALGDTHALVSACFNAPNFALTLEAP